VEPTAGVFGVDTAELADIDETHESSVIFSYADRRKGHAPRGRRAETIGFVIGFV